MKIMLLALNEREGFGKTRLTRVVNRAVEIAQRVKDDRDVAFLIDKQLERLGIDEDFTREGLDF